MLLRVNMIDPQKHFLSVIDYFESYMTIIPAPPELSF